LARAWAALVGVALGFVVTDVLNANGLRWLGWPIAAGLVLFALATGLVLRRAGLG
jgi:hypothetical protein